MFYYPLLLLQAAKDTVLYQAWQLCQVLEMNWWRRLRTWTGIPRLQLCTKQRQTLCLNLPIARVKILLLVITDIAQLLVKHLLYILSSKFFMTHHESCYCQIWVYMYAATLTLSLIIHVFWNIFAGTEPGICLFTESPPQPNERREASCEVPRYECKKLNL